MTTGAKIPTARIEALRSKLMEADAAPVIPPEASTKMGAVAALAPELLGLRRKGWGLAALAAMLREGGLEITSGTLKNYLQRAGATRTRRRSRRERAPTPTPSPLSLPAPPAKQTPATARGYPVVVRPDPAAHPREPGTFVPREDTKDL